MQTRTILTLFLLLFCIEISAQQIPADRLTDWSAAGNRVQWSEPATKLNVLDFGAVADGLTNDHAAVQNALNALNGQAGVVWFPAGSYRIMDVLTVPDSVIIRGAGSDSSRILFDHDTTGFSVVGSYASSWISLTQSATTGSSSIVVANPGTFSVLDWIEIHQTNDAWDVNPAEWSVHAVGQLVRITAIAGDTLFLQDPLRTDLDLTFQPAAAVLNPADRVSIECLYLEQLDSVYQRIGNHVTFRWATDCRMVGVESYKSPGSHVVISQSSNVEVTGCYIHHGYVYSGVGRQGYGVTLENHAGLCLVENNVFQHLRHSMMTKVGANGNVVAYNYSREPNRSEFIASFSGDISCHGHWSYANLFEGNIVQNIITDHFWGPSGQHNTFLRNRCEMFGIIFTEDGTYNWQTDDQNVVGNEVTRTNVDAGDAATMSNFYTLYYDLNGANHFEYGNNDNGTWHPLGSTLLPPSSYYLSGQPHFWTTSNAWPPIGVPYTLGSEHNPAYDRFQAGGTLTICPEIISVGVELIAARAQVQVFPNPATEMVSVIRPAGFETAPLEVFDVHGRVLLTSEKAAATINLSMLSPGIYLVRLKAANAPAPARIVVY